MLMKLHAIGDVQRYCGGRSCFGVFDLGLSFVVCVSAI